MNKIISSLHKKACVCVSTEKCLEVFIPKCKLWFFLNGEIIGGFFCIFLITFK